MNIEDGIPELPIPTPKSAGHDTPRSGGGFTPGPWECHDDLEHPLHLIWWREPHVPLGEPNGPGVLVARTCFAPSSEANARLIAAAPDLLEALQAVMSAHGEQLHDAFDDAHKAISKALGTSPEGLASMAMGGGGSSSQSQPCGEEGPTASLPPAQHFDGKERA